MPPTATPPARLIFAGTPDFAVASLTALLAAEVNIVGVFTQPDRRAGRGKKWTISAVKAKALAHDLPVFQPPDFKSLASRDLVQNLAADLMVVTAYGIILPAKVLALPRLGCINIHASLLPRWRGAAPIQRAIAAGDTHSGICIMQMDKGLDTGAVLATSKLAIGANESGGELHQRLMQQSKITLEQHLMGILNQSLKSTPQSAQGIAYAHKLSPSETRLDWANSAAVLHNKVRAFNPYPMAMSRCNNRDLRILNTRITAQQTARRPGAIVHIDSAGIHVQTGSGCLVLSHLQKLGGKPMEAAALRNGFALNSGDYFT